MMMFCLNIGKPYLKKLFSGTSDTERLLRNVGLGLVNKSHFIKQRLIERALGEIDFE